MWKLQKKGESHGGLNQGNSLNLQENKKTRKMIGNSIAARMMQLLGLPTLLCQPEVHTNLEMIVLYAQEDEMGPLFVTAKLEIDHYGFSNQPSIDSKEA